MNVTHFGINDLADLRRTTLDYTAQAWPGSDGDAQFTLALERDKQDSSRSGSRSRDDVERVGSSLGALRSQGDFQTGSEWRPGLA